MIANFSHFPISLIDTLMNEASDAILVGPELETASDRSSPTETVSCKTSLFYSF